MRTRAVAAPAQRAAGKTARRVLGRCLAYALLALIGVTMVMPFFWMLSTSLKEQGAEFFTPPQWIPQPIQWVNYSTALTAAPFLLFTRNTLVIALTATVGTMLSSSMVAYGFARLRFPGRSLWFGVLLSTLMLPHIVTMIPQFLLFKQLGWVNTFLPLIVPYWFGGNPLYIFLMRQFFMTIPFELEEAARIDGASSPRIWLTIMTPLSLPALATVGIFCLIFHWNDFLLPLIYIREMELRTIALGLQEFQTSAGTKWNLLMAASTATTVPILALFFAAQRYFVKGIITSGFGGR
jgi:ABC-type glycerol-3-phosphate transport system permease component